MWKRDCHTAAKYRMQRYDQTHMEPDFKEGNQVLVSTLTFNNLKGPKKMRDSFLGPFITIKLIEKDEVEFPFRKKTTTQPDIVELEHSPGPAKKIIKARKIRLNGKDQRQYLVRFKIQTKDKGKWLQGDARTDGNLHLRKFRASRRTYQYDQ
ncbi:hypothetical protein O181_033336 [Austropuccinia psidii MF-1]|uniref:Uncharacterized protein n=1 Tax=Austropuccinia psidii MF-1 TaxID=1389203 RepID=A0A9Q3CYK5_9BASI|nr:hypothetical protein [Austropuccinia psidii MF-1]